MARMVVCTYSLEHDMITQDYLSCSVGKIKALMFHPKSSHLFMREEVPFLTDSKLIIFYYVREKRVEIWEKIKDN